MKKKGVEKYRIIGTSTVRNAKNKDWFIEYISKNLGIKIEPVSGREEAYFSFYGALKSPGLNNLKNSTGSMVKKKVLVIDIGGGSSELILGEQSGIPGLAFSIKMGCVNLTEKFIRSEKPGRDELIRLEKYVWSKLNETVKKVKGNKPSLIIGTGGTITTLAAIDLKLEVYDSEKIHGYLLKLNKIGEIYKYLCSLDSNERQKIPGLQFDRADIIISGTAVLLAILKLLEMDVIKVSERDILDGIVYTLVDF